MYAGALSLCARRFHNVQIACGTITFHALAKKENMPGADVIYILCAPAQIKVILARKGDMLPIVRPCYNPAIVGCHYHFLKKVDYTARHSPLIDCYSSSKSLNASSAFTPDSVARISPIARAIVSKLARNSRVLARGKLHSLILAAMISSSGLVAFGKTLA